MSMKFPVKHTEDKSFYLSAKIFLEGKKKQKTNKKIRAKKTSVANPFVLAICIKTG